MSKWSAVGKRKHPIARTAIVLLALITTSCGAHRITSSPSGASVYGLYGSDDAKPKPEELRQFIKTKTTPFTFPSGPSGHWYQVRKENYADSEIIFLPTNTWSGVKSHHFDMEPLPHAHSESTESNRRTPDSEPAKESVILAVFDIEDVTKQLKEQETLQIREFLETRLTELGGFKTIPREQLRQRLQREKAGSYRACFDEACQIELGKEVAAEKSLATRILKVGSTCVVTSKLFDLKTATSEKAASARVACSPEGLLEGINQLAKQLCAP